MARKETIYTVSTETNEVIRVSQTFLAALEFAATLKSGAAYVCTSIFALRKGDVAVDVEVLS